MAAYSKVGLTMVLYAVALTSGLHPWMLRRRNPRVLLDLARILHMCSFQLSLLCNVIVHIAIGYISCCLVFQF